MNYYTWRVDGKPVEVRVNLPMVGYMAPWLVQRAASHPDCFGILLGSVKRRLRGYIVCIDDFDPFDPARLRGTPRAPADTDLKVVGLFRRRTGDLRLDHLDASFIETSFTRPWMVYLLIAPSPDGPDRASFFIQEKGEVHGYTSVGEFPLSADRLREQPVARSSGLPRWIPVAGLAASLLALAGWFVWLRQGSPPPPPARAPVEQQAPPPVVAKPAPSEQAAAPAAAEKNQKRPAKHAKRHASRKRRR